MPSGIPVVVAANGRGIPVRAVTANAPLMTVATNGRGTPIVLSDKGAPFIVQGLYDPAASALFARFTTPPTDARKALINTLITSVKTAGVWTKLDELKVRAAHDAQAARLNWIQDLYNDTAVATPVFTVDRGFTTDGVASYLDRNFNPVTASNPKFSQDSASYGIWNRLTGQNANSLSGWFDGVDGVTLNPRTTTDQFTYRINSAPVAAAATGVVSGAGLSAINRSGSTATQEYKNGAAQTAGSNASAALNSANFTDGHVTAGTWGAGQFAAAFLGESLTVAEHLALYNALNTYLTAVGAA